MEERIINVIANTGFGSRKTTDLLVEKLKKAGFIPKVNNVDSRGELTIAIGGDGAFIKAVNRTHFSRTPIIGINTGHLGFFMEIDPTEDEIDALIESYLAGDYTIQQIAMVGAEIFTNKRSYFLHAINEFVVKAQNSKVIHLDISIDKIPFEKFSGDGVLISTPTGSTGYNLSLGGSVIYPTIDAMTMTPMAPISSEAYRSIKTSIIVPGNHIITVTPEERYANTNLLVVDGKEYVYHGLERINFKIPHKKINRLSVKNVPYWSAFREKFL